MASSSLVHPPCLVHPSRPVPFDARASGSMAAEARRLGRHAHQHHRAADRPRTQRNGHFEDGPNLVTLAMNGWGEGEPAWWLNLQAQPDVRVDLPEGPRMVTARPAGGEERERLWSRWREIDTKLDAYAALSPYRDRGRHPRTAALKGWFFPMAGWGPGCTGAPPRGNRPATERRSRRP